jgi:orotate phosphoribosyltransferase
VTDRDSLLTLLRRRAVLHGDFVLSSGQRSPYYLDARLVTLSARGSCLVGRVFLGCIAGTGAQAVAGLTLGADPIVSAITVAAGLAGQDIDGLLVRKERKQHGASRRIEGPWQAGMRVAVVDDTLTTGASALDAAAAVESEGGAVVGVYALIDRLQGARQAIESRGFHFTALYTVTEILERLPAAK